MMRRTCSGRIHSGIILGTLLSFCATGCDTGIDEQDGGEVVQSAKERITSPDVPQTDLQGLVAGNSAFAFDLYQELRGGGGNMFYSPYSISAALAMTYAGARNETERQMADTLHFTLPQDRLHPAFNGLDLALANRAEGGSDDNDDDGFQLNIANRIWGQIGYFFFGDFLDVLAENYGAGLALLDFSSQPEESRVIINDWVADQTEDKIQDLIPQGGITDSTRLVLTNAIYFKADWSRPFKAADTRDGTFHRLDDSEVTVSMMRQDASFGYAAGDGYQAVELPYEGQKLSMVILLPDAGRFQEFETALDTETVETALEGLAAQPLYLTMPKFTFEWSAFLKDALTALGMPIAFKGGAADFSGMDGSQFFFIGEVIHKAFVAVDEKGTEAAAATAVIMETTSVAPPTLAVTIDRPFFFLIRDIETGTILFVGRVLDPSA